MVGGCYLFLHRFLVLPVSTADHNLFIKTTCRFVQIERYKSRRPRFVTDAVHNDGVNGNLISAIYPPLIPRCDDDTLNWAISYKLTN